MREFYYVIILSLLLPFRGLCQPADQGKRFSLVVVNEKREPLAEATIRMVKTEKGSYQFIISHAGYRSVTTHEYVLPNAGGDTVILVAAANALQEVTVTGRPPVVERKKDKTIVNVEASVTNVGSTVLEVLERSPGVTVDQNGGISLNGKPGVLVMIDDRPTYLSAADLNNMLSSMSASQVARIELVPNPSAKYDAAGTAGIINIKTKKGNMAGLNGSVTTSYGQGRYPKSNNNLVLNFRKGALNAFLTYGFNATKYLSDLYAYRQYYDDNNTVTAILRQPSYFKGTVYNNTLKTGVDYALSSSTSIGMVLTGATIPRKGNNSGQADWLSPNGSIDSSILTTSTPTNQFHHGAVNLNGRQKLSSHAELSADLDYLHYSMRTHQDFDNRLLAPGGYVEVFRSDIPTTIDIASGKLDATMTLPGGYSLQTGVKISSSHTDNAASYQNWENQEWIDDETRSNHFVYRENIRALYGSIEGKYHRLGYTAGLRYEYTSYQAHQFGNSQQGDSSLSRRYGSLFPNGNLSYKPDSANGFTLTITRRLDRPPFQLLNPFLYVINKYTYQTGNAYLLPQYSWNIELGHQYKDLLNTTVFYTRLTNYISQIFLSDTSKTILFYAQGNVGSVDNLGVTESITLSPLKWWSLQLTGVYTYKRFKGFNGNSYESSIHQLNVNVNNQIDFGKGYAGELSGFYTTRARNDIQERLYPTGQMSTGLSKTVLKKKGTIKLSYRDIFYTSAMEGLTSFPSATEYFKIKRDSRVLTLAFTYRFGKNFKVKRHEEGASEEKDRVNNG